MADGQVVFEISGDNRKVKDTLRDTTNAIEREGKNWDKAAAQAGDSIQDRFAKVFKGIAASAVAAKVGKALLDFGADAIQAASDLEEVQNVVDVTFGDGAAKIESWAKAAGTQFGLTETQAKRFTSTLGAMMKSAGIAGPEIVNMSTDLAGLAADMASFYNLDFDTAFQKIRSGISGETEPLKQLGINMSVANLEAYALTQGITKAFDEMSQGEQTMLRYQYLMQATADAQGDFARTSDGYANSVRTLETNIANLKTNVGQILIPVVNEVVGGINDMISALTATPERTVLDDFADIDLKTEEKLLEIEATAEEATLLADQLEELAASVDSLNPTVDTGKWETLLTALTSSGNIDLSGAGKSVEDFAKALNGTDPGTDRAKAWQELLGALSSDVEGLSKLTGTSAEETAAWLKELAEGANALDPNSAEGWDKLFTQLVAGLPGLEGTEFAGLFSQISGEAGSAENNLKALGYNTDEIADKQAAWLEVCRRLVQTIPGLSEIINTETGEVKGGTEAVKEYIKAWQEGQTKLAMMNALQQKESALSERFADIPGLQLDAALAERRVRQNREKMDAILKKYGFSGDRPYNFNSVMASEYGISKEDFDTYNQLAQAEAELEDDAKATAAAYQTQKDALDEAQAALEEYRETIDEMPGEIEVATEATEEWTEAQKTGATEAVEATTKALEAVEAYYKRIREDTDRSLQSVVGGFQEIQTPAEKAREKMTDLTKQIDELNAAGKDSSGLSKTFTEAEASIPSIQNMTKALEDQLQYLNDYQAALDRARERGVSEDVLASLADGSAESYDYLNALANDGSPEAISRLNKLYAQVQEGRDSLSASLTDTRLAADDEFQSLVDTAQAAAEDLDQYGTAETAMANTVQGIADGIADKIPDVQAQVDALNQVLSNLGNVGGLVGGLFGGGFKIDGSHANGLDYVPFNNYLAQLHEGESILTAEEARVWRSFKNGGNAVRNNIDYGALHGAIWDGAPKMGGDVYLDGRTVGRVISDQQGNSLRALERSGWQR
jgi:hypothetical protein